MANMKINGTYATYTAVYPSSNKLTFFFSGNITEVSSYGSLFSGKPEIRLLKPDGMTMAMYAGRSLLSVTFEPENNRIVVVMQVDPLEQTEADKMREEIALYKETIDTHVKTISEQAEKIAVQESKIEAQEARIASQATEIENLSTALTEANAKIDALTSELEETEAIMTAIEEGIADA